MTTRTFLAVSLTAMTILCIAASTASQAHDSAGQREFPATLAIEDPGVGNELSLPHVHSFKEREDGETNRVTEYESELSLLLTEKFGLSVEGAYVDQNGGENGFDNWGLAAKYKFLENDEHEILISLGLDWDIGDSGEEDIGAEDFSTLTPRLFFGKGFGDLPDSVEWLKPFALTGSVGVAYPFDSGESDTLTYGFTVQYSLPYLQQHVRDIGLQAPFDNLVPVVEFTFDTPLNNTDNHRTTGTINPGFIWTGEQMQIGLEAVLPLNDDSGKGVGVSAQLHFNLDDIFPATFGHPLLGD